jgi:hypothetical protein
VVDIFDEVEEELRAERAEKLLKKYGVAIVGAACAVVLAVAGWQAWGWWQARQDKAAAAQYIAAMTVADAAGSNTATQQGALREFDALAVSAPQGYRTLSRLRAAALKAEAGDVAGASVLWNQVAGDESADKLLRDLASLQWAQHQIDTGDPSLTSARLKALAAPDNPWAPLAEEQLAVLDLRQGKTDDAKAALRRLAQDVTAPNGVRTRAAGLLSHLGG